MNKERLYQVQGRCDNSDATFERVMLLSMGENILEEAEKCMNQEYDGEKYCKVTEIIEIPKCEGCQIEACGQRDHMLHPNGCLHDRSDCDLCQLQLKIF